MLTFRVGLKSRKMAEAPENPGSPRTGPGSRGRSEIRILLVFDPWRSAVLLVAGDKSGQWDKWYRTAIPHAEQLYDDYLAERRKEMGP